MVRIKPCLLSFVQNTAWSPTWSLTRGKITEKFPVRALKKWSRSSTRGGLLREVTNIVIWLRDKTVLEKRSLMRGRLLREVVSHGGSTVFSHVELNLVSSHVKISVMLYVLSSLSSFWTKLNSFLYDRNIFEDCSEIFGNLRQSLVIFGNFRTSSKIFGKLIGNVRINFGQCSETTRYLTSLISQLDISLSERSEDKIRFHTRAISSIYFVT